MLLALVALAYGQTFELSHELAPGGRLLAVSSDGRYVVVESVLAPLTVWDLETARIVALFEGHPLTADAMGPTVSVVDRALVSGEWLISAASSQGREVAVGLLAQHLVTGERRELARGNCDGLASTPEGFAASCQGSLSLWRVAEDIAEMGRQALWLYELYVDADRQELWGVRLDPLAAGIEALSYPALAPLRSMPGDYLRLLGVDAAGEPIALRWEEALVLEQGSRRLVLPETSAAEVSLSVDGTYLMLPLAPSGAYQLLRLADGALLENPIEVPFSLNLAQRWHPAGILSWTQAPTYYHDLLRLWQPAASELVTRGGDPLVIYGEGDWQVIWPRDFERFAKPRYHPEAEALVRQLFAEFETEALELNFTPLGAGQLMATVTLAYFDDSVRAGRFELGLKQLALAGGEVWALWEAREQWQCARGELAGVWTTALCP
jgi:hypothetical protein